MVAVVDAGCGMVMMDMVGGGGMVVMVRVDGGGMVMMVVVVVVVVWL